MAFSMETVVSVPDAGMYRGKAQEVACGCWFTSKGGTMPRMLKYLDEEGVIRTLRDITVLREEEKYYSGIRTREYQCEARIDGVCFPFLLLFRPEHCTWSICFL